MPAGQWGDRPRWNPRYARRIAGCGTVLAPRRLDAAGWIAAADAAADNRWHEPPENFFAAHRD